MRYLVYGGMPLLVLLAAASLACIVGYFVALGVDALPLHKIISKGTQLFLVLSIFPAMRYLHLTWRDLGFAERPVFLRQLLQGFALGFMTLMPVFVVLYALGIHVLDDGQTWTAARLAGKLALSLVLALIISLIEEPLFRGVLLTGLRKKMPVAAAIFLSAGYYAALHFLTSKTQIPPAELNVFSGFKLLGEAFANLFNPVTASAFVSLLMVGIFLGLLRTRTNTSLGLCIGCHTAWVWQIKMSKELFNTDANSAYLYLVSSYDGVIGPLVTGWLLLAVIAYMAYRKLAGPTPGL